MSKMSDRLRAIAENLDMVDSFNVQEAAHVLDAAEKALRPFAIAAEMPNEEDDYMRAAEVYRRLKDDQP
jgi:predicted DNA-binding protein